MKQRVSTCFICGKEAAAPFLPFCSARCKQLDLGNWLSGRYSIPATDQTPDNEEEE